MTTKRLFLLIVLLCLVGVGAAQALTASAQGVLLTYYTSINLKDYRLRL